VVVALRLLPRVTSCWDELTHFSITLSLQLMKPAIFWDYLISTTPMEADEG
jgi:hypothetical protein